MIELPKALNADWAPLTWHAYQAQDGKPQVVINDGSDLLSLARHTIESDGTVKPSVLCTTCGFHNDVKLLGWTK
ncbi:MAG: hypothetical protein ABSE39_04670 [Candidatus Bathyarchaeia archaeon]|jgi:hypothetical protein